MANLKNIRFMSETSFNNLASTDENDLYFVEYTEPEIPTKVSELENDSGFLTSHQDISGKADKATTLAGYGIENAYTKAEVDAKLSSVYKYKGTVATYDALPTSGQVEGDVYNVESTGDNYAWVAAKGEVEAHWDKLAGVVDLSDLTLDSSLATVAKSGSYNDLIDKPTIDDALNKTSSNAVKNSAVATEIETIQTTIGSIAGNVQSNQQAIQSLTSNKQATLVSGTNIKTINGESVLGSGDIDTKELLVMTTDVVMGATPALQLSKTYEEITNALDDGKLPIVFHNNLVFTFFKQDDANNTILFTARYVNGDSTFVNIMDIILTVYEDNHVETTTLAYGINPAVMYSGITAEKVATYDGYDTTISGKADKATTLAGYGIGDAYTKTEVDSKLSSVYRYKGTVATVDALPSSGNIEGDVYNVEATGDNYAWVDEREESGETIEGHWDKLAGVVDLSDLTLDSSLATVAKSGSYNDLTDKPDLSNLTSVIIRYWDSDSSDSK